MASKYEFFLKKVDQEERTLVDGAPTDEKAEKVYKKLKSKYRRDEPTELIFQKNLQDGSEEILGCYRLDKIWSGPREQETSRLARGGSVGGVIPGQGLKKGYRNKTSIGRDVYHGGLRWSEKEYEDINLAVARYNDIAGAINERPETFSSLLRYWTLKYSSQLTRGKIVGSDEAAGQRSIFKCGIWWSDAEYALAEKGLTSLQKKLKDEETTISDLVRMAAIAETRVILEATDNKISFVEKGEPEKKITKNRIVWKESELSQTESYYESAGEKYSGLGWGGFLREVFLDQAAKTLKQKRIGKTDMPKRTISKCGMYWYDWEYDMAELYLAHEIEITGNRKLSMRDLIKKAVIAKAQNKR